MGKHPTDNPSKYPPLGRALMWVDKPRSANTIIRALAIACGLLFLADFTYEKYGHLTAEYIPGFFGVYGFVMFAALIIAARTLRKVIKRPEDYYGDTSIDTEDYPADQLEKVDTDVS